MATYTSHLNLKLPDYSDTADIKDLNENFKKIDDAIASGGTGGGTGGGIVTETDPTVPSWAKQPSKPTYTAAEVGALPDTTVIPTVPSALPNPQPIVINGISYDGSERKEITVSAGDGGSITETDPTVPAWAKAENKPSYTAEEVGALPSTYKPPVTSVNGKTGAVSLVASDVGALPNTTVIPTVPTALKNPYPLTINGVSYDGSEAKTVTIESTGGGASVELDTTLTQYGKAADAGAVGNAIAQETAAREAAVNSLNQANAAQDTRLTALEQNAPSGTSGLTTAQVNALDGMFNVVAYDGDKDYAAAYEAFKSAFGIVTTYTIKNNLTNVTSDNDAASITGGSAYTATLTVTDGYTMSAVFVYMGGTDITSTAYANGVINIESVTGDIVISATATVAGVTTYTITNNLTNATSSNPVVSIEEGQAYSATITPDEGYTLTGGTVSVTMGGSDVTASTYADGVVTISAVTGDVVITVAAAMVESNEITYVNYIATDGTAVIDTGYVPTSINDKMLIGVKYFAANEIDSSITNRTFFGRSYPYGSTYGDIKAYTESTLTSEHYPYRMSMNVNASAVSTLSSIQANYDDGTYATFVKQPIYYYWSNGSQKLYEDYEMTTQPKQGTFGAVERTIATGTNKEIAINSMWIGGCFNGYAGNMPVGFPVYIYGFKAWDENDNLLCDLRPARKGVEGGLYDVVNNVFHGNGADGGTITCGEDVTS